jgi:hypothetical protein
VGCSIHGVGARFVVIVPREGGNRMSDARVFLLLLMMKLMLLVLGAIAVIIMIKKIIADKNQNHNHQAREDDLDHRYHDQHCDYY